MHKIAITLSVLALLTTKSVSAQGTSAGSPSSSCALQKPKHSPFCNHKCAVRCAAEDQDEKCHKHCGCLPGEGHQDLEKVHKSYERMQLAQTDFQIADGMVSLMSFNPNHQSFVAAADGAHNTFSDNYLSFQYQSEVAGLDHNQCNMKCVSSCSTPDLKQSPKCFKNCACQSEGKALKDHVSKVDWDTQPYEGFANKAEFEQYEKDPCVYAGQSAQKQDVVPKFGDLLALYGYYGSEQGHSSRSSYSSQSQCPCQSVSHHQRSEAAATVENEHGLAAEAGEILESGAALTEVGEVGEVITTTTTTEATEITTTAGEALEAAELEGKGVASMTEVEYQTYLNGLQEQEMIGASAAATHYAETNQELIQGEWAQTTVEVVTDKKIGEGEKVVEVKLSTVNEKISTGATTTATTTATTVEPTKKGICAQCATCTTATSSATTTTTTAAKVGTTTTATTTTAAVTETKVDATKTTTATTTTTAPVTTATTTSTTTPAVTTTSTVASTTPAVTSTTVTTPASTTSTGTTIAGATSTTAAVTTTTTATTTPVTTATTTTVPATTVTSTTVPVTTATTTTVPATTVTATTVPATTATTTTAPATTITTTVDTKTTPVATATSATTTNAATTTQTTSTTSTTVPVTATTTTVTATSAVVPTTTTTTAATVTTATTQPVVATTTVATATATPIATCIPAQAVISTVTTSSLTNTTYERLLDTQKISGLAEKKTIKVYNLPEFSNGQRVEVFINGTLKANYVLLHNRTTEQQVIILDTNTYVIKHVYKASMNKLTSTVDLVNTTADNVTMAYIKKFIDIQTAYIINNRRVIAVGKAAALYMHHTHAEEVSVNKKTNGNGNGFNGNKLEPGEIAMDAVKGWKATVVNQTRTLSVVNVEGLDINNKPIVKYDVHATQVDNFTNAYMIKVMCNESLHRFDVVVQQTTGVSTLSYDTLVVKNKTAVCQNIITLELLSGGTTFKATNVNLTTIDVNLQTIIKNYIKIRDQINLSQETIVAVQGLLKWLFNANLSAVKISKISESMRGSRIRIDYLNKTYMTDVITVDFQHLRGMYQIHLKEPTGATTIYSLAVLWKGDMIYDVSVLIGNVLVESYQIQLQPIHGAVHSYIAVSVTPIPECSDLRQIILMLQRYLQIYGAPASSVVITTTPAAITKTSVATTTTTVPVVATTTTATTTKDIKITTAPVITTKTTTAVPDIKITTTPAAATTQTTTTVPDIKITTTPAATTTQTTTTVPDIKITTAPAATTTKTTSTVPDIQITTTPAATKTVTTTQDIKITTAPASTTTTTSTTPDIQISTKPATTTTTSTSTVVPDIKLTTPTATTTTTTVVPEVKVSTQTAGATTTASTTQTTVTVPTTTASTTQTTVTVPTTTASTTQTTVTVPTTTASTTASTTQTSTTVPAATASTTTTQTSTTTTTATTATSGTVTASTADYQLIILDDGTRYKLYANGEVRSMSGVLISTGGLSGFQLYLSKQTIIRTVTTTMAADYQIVIADGIEYQLYTNNSVYISGGKLITTTGIEGLKAYLTTSTTTVIVADYQIVNANGVDYWLYNNGSVYTATGKFVCTGGVEGLKTYILSTTVVDYQIVTANGVDYYVYTNNTVTTVAGKVISTGGIEGLKTYLLSQTSSTTTTTTVVADYQIVTANNVDYHVYNNGSVYTVVGKLVCTGGIEGLKTYLLSGASSTATTTTTTTGGVAQQGASTTSTTYTTYTTSTTSAGGVTTTSSTTGAKALFADQIPNAESTMSGQTVYIMTIVLIIVAISSFYGYKKYKEMKEKEELADMKFYTLLDENKLREQEAENMRYSNYV